MPLTDLQAAWGKRLAARRKDAKLTQQSLAGSAGISRVYLARLEAGLYAPGDPIRIRLAAALGTTVPDLFPHDITTTDAA